MYLISSSTFSQVDISSGTTSYRSILGECVNKVQGTFYSVNTGGPEEASFVRYSLTERQKDQKIDWIELEGQYDIFKCDEMARLGGKFLKNVRPVLITEEPLRKSTNSLLL